MLAIKTFFNRQADIVRLSDIVSKEKDHKYFFTHIRLQANAQKRLSADAEDSDSFACGKENTNVVLLSHTQVA